MCVLPLSAWFSAIPEAWRLCPDSLKECATDEDRAQAASKVFLDKHAFSYLKGSVSLDALRRIDVYHDLRVPFVVPCGGWKKFPWKNMPLWPPLYHRHQRALNSPSSEPPSDALRADTDNVKPILAASEPPPEDTRPKIRRRFRKQRL